MKIRLMNWLLTPLHLAAFVTIVVTLHPLFYLCGRFGQPSLMERLHQLHCRLHILNLKLIGARFAIDIAQLPLGRPVIFVANHQSMYDPLLFAWHLKQFTPRYIAKIELGGSIPTISYCLKNANHLIIKRQDADAALTLIEQYAKWLEREARSAVLFPEGTRSHDGKLKPFKVRGFKTLLDNMPSALVVPVALDGFWKLFENSLLPITAGATLHFSVLPPIEPVDRSPEEILAEVEQLIKDQLTCFRQGG